MVTGPRKCHIRFNADYNSNRGDHKMIAKLLALFVVAFLVVSPSYADVYMSWRISRHG